MHRPLPLLATLVACLIGVACRNAPPEDVAAMVNSRPITNDQVERQYKVFFASESDSVSADERSSRKLEIVRSLIDMEIMLQRAEKLNLMAVDSDVEAKFTELRAPYTQEEFEKQLKSQNMTQDDLRAQLRRDLSITKLFNKEITSHITITDQDVADYYNKNKANFNLVEPQLHLAQILVTPHADPEVRNLRSDKAQNDEQARAKISAIDAGVFRRRRDRTEWRRSWLHP
jgi:peptidyl-prolyl cis-trans isomerase SurA